MTTIITEYSINRFSQDLILDDLPPPKMDCAFYQTKLFGYFVACITLAAGFYMPYFCAQMRMQNPRFRTLKWVTGLNFAFYLVLISRHFFTKCYYTDPSDPSERRKIRQNLEENKTSIEEFFQSHNWKNIRFYGLYLAENNEPIISKEKLRELAFFYLDNNPTLLFSPVFLHKSHISRVQGPIWEMIEHNLFTQKELDDIAQLITTKLSLTQLLENYPLIKKHKLSSYLSLEQIKWLEEHLKDYKKLKETYVKQTTQLHFKYAKLQQSNIFESILVASIFLCIFLPYNLKTSLLMSYGFFLQDVIFRIDTDNDLAPYFAKQTIKYSRSKPFFEKKGYSCSDH